MVVLRVRGHGHDPVLRVFAHAVGMANIEVETGPVRVDPIDERQVLVELLDQELGLGLDEQRISSCLGDFQAGHELVVEDIGGLVPGLVFGQVTARLGGNVPWRRVPWPDAENASCARGEWRGSAGRDRSSRGASTAAADRRRRSS